MADIREEDFTRLQAQIIDLRTANYDNEVKLQRQSNELEQLREKSSQLEKELEKSNKIIQKSKNKKEYALLLDENEGLQLRLRDHEEDFKLQNKTLLEEVARIEEENKKLLEELKNFRSGKDVDSGSTHEAELRRLKAENAALQNSLKTTQALYETELKRSQENDPGASPGKETTSDSQTRKNDSEDAEKDKENTDGNSSRIFNQEKHSSKEQIKTELEKLITSVFETFCGSLISDSKLSNNAVGKSGVNSTLPELGETLSTNDLKDRSSERQGTDAISDCQTSAEDSKEEKVDNGDAMLENQETVLPQDSRGQKTENDNKICESRETGLDENNEQLNSQVFQCSSESFVHLKENILSEVHVLLEERDIFLTSRTETQNSQKKPDEGITLQHSTQLTELQLNLATEREEKRLLEEQLHNLEASLKKEISKLDDEVEKLTEKARRKQESFTQLQEEKEKLYNENRRTIEDMKESHLKEIKNLTVRITQLTQELDDCRKQLSELQRVSEDKIKELNEKLVVQENQATSNVEETIQELDNARIENSSLCEQLQSLQEACGSYRNENEDQKAMIIGMQEKMKDSEKREMALKSDNDKLKSEIQESGLSYEHLRRQMDEMMSEKEQYLQSTNEAAKLAEKRKQMLDEFSITQQRMVTEHREQMEKLETSYKEAAKKIQDEYKKTIEDLKTQLQGEKKLKKELEEMEQKFSDCSQQLTSVESKCSWFERRLSETEKILSEEREKSSETLEDLKREHALNTSEISVKHSSEVQELNGKIKTLEGEKEDQVKLIERCKQELKDKDVENVIAGKKGTQLVKDLKRQLKTERKKSEQLQQRLQEAASESRARESFEKLFDPNVSRESTRRNSGDSSMLSGSSLTFDNHDPKEASPDSSINVSVNDETADLIARVAELQQEKWRLEEQVRHLEENCSAMAEDLMQKSAVIQHYAMDTKLDVGKELVPQTESNFKSKMKGTFNIGKNEELLRDMNKKLQRMLEETLMKNIQLQKDVDALTK